MAGRRVGGCERTGVEEPPPEAMKRARPRVRAQIPPARPEGRKGYEAWITAVILLSTKLGEMDGDLKRDGNYCRHHRILNLIPKRNGFGAAEETALELRLGPPVGTGQKPRSSVKRNTLLPLLLLGTASLVFLVTQREVSLAQVMPSHKRKAELVMEQSAFYSRHSSKLLRAVNVL